MHLRWCRYVGTYSGKYEHMPSFTDGRHSSAITVARLNTGRSTNRGLVFRQEQEILLFLKSPAQNKASSRAVDTDSYLSGSNAAFWA
jgi:hypothetical protein